MEMKNRLDKSSGFTLLELLVVMAIIGTLAVVLMVVINPAEMARRSRDAKRLSDLGTVKSAIDLALSDGKELTDTGWITFTSSTSASSFDGSILDLSKYLSVVPENPGGNTQYVKADCTTGSTTPADMAYMYKGDKTNGVYVLKAKLESTTNCEKIQKDGNNDDYYELGTDPGLDL